MKIAIALSFLTVALAAPTRTLESRQQSDMSSSSNMGSSGSTNSNKDSSSSNIGSTSSNMGSTVPMPSNIPGSVPGADGSSDNSGGSSSFSGSFGIIPPDLSSLRSLLGGSGLDLSSLFNGLNGGSGGSGGGSEGGLSGLSNLLPGAAGGGGGDQGGSSSSNTTGDLSSLSGLTSGGNGGSGGAGGANPLSRRDGFVSLFSRKRSMSSTANDVTDHKDCQELTFLFARGAAEPGNMGTVVGPDLAKQLTKLTKNKVNVQGVDYPVSAENDASLGAAGGRKMASLVEDALQQCPDTKVVLGGYSQGTTVVHNAANKLSKGQVAAAVLFGDPYQMRPLGKLDDSKVKEFCAVGDPVCQNGDVAMAHMSYGKNAKEAAKFLLRAAEISA
ncbi:hypothetical protein EYZ11_006410 [Aspergillus tanneri]|uniref:Cutinase n=1 Tax=Aspergillus tanneri TaxID=1220188 RepID=A0A4S3JLE8_9EURO|nr:uncharacterized protein ATNIH1004_008129 [Aspergillus tanneri]KAA8643933.1 hypothetical protein ATNIH1004_008129 [Aspergillus tanneri]THC94121.1 hypothetical protein EYZ11_006410 [Aspergillus tanneri]